MVNLEGHQAWTASGLQKLTFSANGSADHRGDRCLPEAQSSLSEPDEDIHKKKKSFVCVSHNNNEFVEAVCLQEESVIPSEAPLDPSPLGSALVSTLPGSNNCFSLPVPVAEGQSDQNHSGQTGDSNSRCVKTDFTKLEPISNGHVFMPAEDQYPVPNVDSVPPLTVPGSSRRLLDLPRIVKHRPSSITFSHYTCPSQAFVTESSDDGESSLEEEEEEDDHGDGDDDDDDDVFPELPQSREYLVNHRQRSKDKQKRRGAASARNCGHEAEGDTSSKEVCCCY